MLEAHAKDLMERKENQRLGHANINSCRTLEARAFRLELQYVGHILRRHHSTEKDLLTGMEMEEKEGQTQQELLGMDEGRHRQECCPFGLHDARHR